MADAPSEAGWHPDPNGAHELRFFDGAVWTGHVSDRGVAAYDAYRLDGWRPEAVVTDPAPVAQSAMAPPGFYDDPRYPGVKSFWNGKAWAEDSAPRPRESDGQWILFAGVAAIVLFVVPFILGLLL